MEITMKHFSNVTWISLSATHNTNEVGKATCHSNALISLVKKLLNGRST